MRKPLTTHQSPLTVLLPVLICVAVGCGGKVAQFSTPDQQKMLKRIETSVTARKSGPFEQLRKQVDQMHEQGKLTDEQYGVLDKVCARALVGDWDRADAELKPLLAAQEKKD